MRYSVPRGALLVTAKEAAKRKKNLGLAGEGKPRGLGYKPPKDDNSASEESDAARRDAAKDTFMVNCARAYATGILNTTIPPAPPLLIREVRKAGGNIRWLSIDTRRQHTFHYYYCQFVKKNIPFEMVWKRK